MSAIQQAILEKKAALADAVGQPMADIAQRSAAVWPDADALDKILSESIDKIPSCHLLYAWDVDGIEISSMVQKTDIDNSWRGKDLSQRPYLKNNLPFKGVMLSSVYESMYTHGQCITVLQAVNSDHELMGFVAAGFSVNDLLRDVSLIVPEMHWQQFRGDPAVRGTVFMQERAQSALDDHIDAFNDLISNLICRHGVFHSKIHYSSGRCSLWLLDDPYNYRIHSVDEIIDPDICLAYPMHKYPEEAKMSCQQVKDVLDEFKDLRFADETIYLRSSSINIMNGMLGLTFSCDGSHYMPADEFLERDLSFWLGTLKN